MNEYDELVQAVEPVWAPVRFTVCATELSQAPDRVMGAKLV